MFRLARVTSRPAAQLKLITDSDSEFTFDGIFERKRRWVQILSPRFMVLQTNLSPHSLHAKVKLSPDPVG